MLFGQWKLFHRGLYWTCVLSLACVQGSAFGEEAANHAATEYPDIVRALESMGYAAADYRVLLAWNEASPRVEGVVITGYRLGESDGSDGSVRSTGFDLYFGPDGALLDDDQLYAFGIQAKRWDRPPISLPAQRLTTPSKMDTRVSPQPLGAWLPNGPSSLIELPPIDLGLALEQDASGESTADKGVARTGVFQEIDPVIAVTAGGASHGVWETLDDGTRLWSATLYSPDAVGQRVHFAALDLPEGAQVIVYNMTDPSEAYGPYYGPAKGQTDQWSATCFSDAVTVECTVPANAAADSLDIQIGTIIHVYQNPEVSTTQKSGACNLDVSCYGNWANAASSVAAFNFVGPTGGLYCTGTLLVDSNPGSAIPYFLTANHCFANGGKPETMEIFWFYQTPSCNGTAPTLASVPRSENGSVYLASAKAETGTDFYLVRLNDTPPEGAAFAGWTTAEPAFDTEMVCIHHPSSDRKKISFGKHISAADPCYAGMPTDRYIRNLWHDGTTEGGS
ncbi:MAG: Trypsin-like serine protease, partial [Candidatus Hydrogenedentes bacterium]|nr:Trypsin-like serine protease [Candidatus Hydrogenedentota bacterium]